MVQAEDVKNQSLHGDECRLKVYLSYRLLRTMSDILTFRLQFRSDYENGYGRKSVFSSLSGIAIFGNFENCFFPLQTVGTMSERTKGKNRIVRDKFMR